MMKNGPRKILIDDHIKKIKEVIKKYPTKIAFCKATGIHPATLESILFKKRCSQKTFNKINKLK